MRPDAAVRRVRDARGPGAVETPAQEAHVLGCVPQAPADPSRTMESIRNRALGAFLGLAVGDGVGTTLEFSPRDAQPRLVDMVGGGPFALTPGAWTDDTAMALALADSLATSLPGQLVDLRHVQVGLEDGSWGARRPQRAPPPAAGAGPRLGGFFHDDARAAVGAVAVVALVVHVPAGPHGGAGAPAELALRTGALGRHAWLPTHRRPFAAAHSPCLSRPPERMWTDAACPRLPPRGGTESMTPHETGSTTTPGAPRATAPLTRTFGPQGPTLGDLSDAYLQDYQVRQFRSQSTARGRTAHLAAFFGRAARAATLTTYQIRQYQLTRRAAGAATGTINRETSALHRMCTLAVHWGWLDTVPGFPDRLRENPPRQGFFEHPEYLAVRAHLPAPWQDILDLAYYSGWRKQEILGLTWEEIDMAGGVIRLSPARSKTLVGRILPISHPIAEALVRRRARRDPDSPLVFHRDGIPVRRWRTAWRTACQATGVPTRFLHDCRRTAARNLIRANVPERVAMLLTGHKSRAIFDRYNIIDEQELLDAGDQLVAYLAQQAQPVPARRRPHAAGPAAPRTASPLRLVRRGTA